MNDDTSGSSISGTIYAISVGEQSIATRSIMAGWFAHVLFVTLTMGDSDCLAQTSEKTQAVQQTESAQRSTAPIEKVGNPSRLDAEFDDLAKRYEQAEEAHSLAYEAATTDEERAEVYLRFDPENAIAADFLEFANAHPNTDRGVDALAFLIGRAVSYGDVDAPATKARQAAIKLAADKFIQRESLDLCLKGFQVGVVFPEAEASFRKIAEKSPHSHVRAAAMLELGKWVKFKASIPEIKRNLQERINQSDVNEPTLMSKREFDVFTGPIDPQAAIGEAVEVAQRIQRAYPDVLAAAYEGKGTAELRNQRVSDEEAKSWKLRSYAQQPRRSSLICPIWRRAEVLPTLKARTRKAKRFG